jgi:N6-adenosine-specific RNA methylase IME4
MNLLSLPQRYGCVIADPPWPEYGGGQIKRGADRHYPLMKVEEIAALPVGSITLPDAHLYLWVTNNYLERAFEVVRAWGFKYLTTITWEKERQGLGQYFRGTTEHVLFCRRGQPPYRINPETGKRAQGRTSFETFGDFESSLQPGAICTVEKCEGLYFTERRLGAHSEKPSRIHQWAELVSHGPYLEMFARSARPGWDAWGNEAPAPVEDLLR